MVSIILGSLFGLFNFKNYMSIYYGELLLIIYLFYKIIHYRIKLSENINIIVFFLIIIFYISLYWLFDIVSYEYIWKNIFKYIVILIETILFYFNFMIDRRKHFLLLFGFLFTSYISMFMASNDTFNLIKFGHIFPLCLCELFYIFQKESDNKRIIILNLFVLLLSVFFRSRTNILISMTFFLIIFCRKIANNYKTGKSGFIKNIFIIVFISLLTMYGSINFINNILSSTASNNERRILIDISIKEFKDSPIIGVGVGNFNIYANTNYSYNIDQNIGPHNLFLEILSEMGIIGVIIVTMFLLYLTCICIKNRNIYQILFFDFLIIYYMFNTFSGLNRMIFSLVISIILVTNYKNLHKKRGNL